jgi:hypothetical protein
MQITCRDVNRHTVNYTVEFQYLFGGTDGFIVRRVTYRKLAKYETHSK